MDLRPTDSQRMLAEAARGLLAGRVDRAALDAAAASASGYDRGLWHEIVGLGWTGLLAPEHLGGAGSDVLHLGTLIEEVGRCAAALPLRSCVAGAALLVSRLGEGAAADACTRAIAAGQLLAVLHAPPGPARLGRVQELGSGALALTAPERVVEWAEQADALLVPAILDDGRGAILALVRPGQPGVTVRPAESFDNERIARVRVDGARVEPGEALNAQPIESDALDDALALVAVLRAAEILGGTRAVLEMTVGYVKDRRQFDRPLGAFQVVRHRCADMATEVDALALLTAEALARASTGIPHRRIAAATAVVAARAAERVLMAGSQLHGGVGFITEYRLHWLYRRLKAQQLRLGSMRELTDWTSPELLDVGRSLAPFAELALGAAHA
jgi:alkylation response protein AidB-like acyl-CoA dehydrogenase